MGKGKKNTKGKGKAAAGKSRAAAFVAFLRSQRFAHIRGAVYVLFSVFLVIAMVGFYVTDARGGWTGSLGKEVAELFAVNLFGIGSLGFALLFFVYGMRLWGVVVMPWWKTFGSTLFWMLWCSLTLGYIGGAWVKSEGFENYAGIGLLMAEPLHSLLSWWTLVVLLFLAVLFLVLVHKMELPKVDVKGLAKKVEHEIEVAATEREHEEKKKEGVELTSEVAALMNEADEAEPESPAEAEEDEGADFDEEAMRLFHQPADVAEEQPAAE